MAEPTTELVSKRGRKHRVYNANVSGSFVARFVTTPEFTKNSSGNYVPYVFTNMGTYYQIQHPWSSARFYDYYTEVWDEGFTSVKIYDDRWAVEYQNKQGKWVDSSFYGVVRSYEIVVDGIKLRRTGNTDIGQRVEEYYYRDGSPCKITITQYSTEAKTVRFLWKPSGIVASSDTTIVQDIGEHKDKVAGVKFNKADGSLAHVIRWYDELNIAPIITVVTDTHVQGRKATVTLSEFNIPAGGSVSIDPDTFYPDADAETSSCDGWVHGDNAAGATWATIVEGAGVGGSASDVYLIGTEFRGYTVSGKWDRLRRGIAGFDTSSIPDGATITAATLSFYGRAKEDSLSVTPNINVYSAAPASPTNLVAGDFDSTGTTAFCDTAITYAGWNTGTPGTINNFVLNAAGLASISKVAATFFALQNANYDVAERLGTSAPTWGSGLTSHIQAWGSEQGAGYKPQLVVTYTVTQQAAGEGSITPTGTLGRKTLTSTGAGAITPASTLGRNIFLSTGTGGITPSGVLGRLTKITVGEGSVTIAGVVAAALTFFQNTGQGAVSLAGTLGRAIKLAVGSGSVTPAGILGRTIKISIGSGSITPSGAINRVIKLITGSGSVTPSGSLARRVIVLLLRIISVLSGNLFLTSALSTSLTIESTLSTDLTISSTFPKH